MDFYIPRCLIKTIVLHIVCVLSLSSVSFSAIAANEWVKNGDYIGAWQSNQMHYKFQKIANKIVFELWKSTEGKPEGIGLFYTPKGKCLGEMSVNSTNTRLIFKPLDKASCHGFNGGHFNIGRNYGKRSLMLTFVSDGVPDSPMLAIYNTASFNRVALTPAALTSYVAKARGPGKSISDSMKQSAGVHTDVIKQFRKDIARDFSKHFPESKLIGVWKGKFIDNQQTLPAEIAIWSMKDTFVHKIVGISSFQGKLCTAAVFARDDSTHITWAMDSQINSSKTKQCYNIGGSGSVRMSKDGNTMVIYLRADKSSFNGMSKQSCLRDLPNTDEFSSCVISGLFTRSTASDNLNKDMANSNWSYSFKSPAESDWEIIKRNGSGLTKLAVAHDKGMQENARYYARLKQSRIEAERNEKQQHKERIEHKRQQEAAKKERSKRREHEWEMRRLGKWKGPGSMPIVLPVLPKVSGPLDGLRGGDYLNALFHGNYKAIAQFDEYYQLRKIKQRRDWIGEHWTDKTMNAAVKSLRLADTVMTIYIFDYRNKYAACLKKDAKVYQVSKEHPDIVTRNGYGQVISREHGWTDRYTYKFNKEFETAFRRLGTTEPESAMAGISDLLLNQGGTDLRQELIAGTRQMMGKFKCDSNIIKRIEQTLLTFSSR